MSRRSLIADEKFVSGYNCAQAVLFSFADRIGLPPDSVLKAACAFGAGMGRVVALLSIGFFAAWSLGKMVFFAIGIRYLRRPNIRRLFDDTATAE